MLSGLMFFSIVEGVRVNVKRLNSTNIPIIAGCLMLEATLRSVLVF